MRWLVLLLLWAPVSVRANVCVEALLAFQALFPGLRHAGPNPALSAVAKEKERGIVTPRLTLKRLEARDVSKVEAMVRDGADTLLETSDAASIKLATQALVDGGRSHAITNDYGDAVVLAIYENSTKRLAGFITLRHSRQSNVFRIPFVIGQEFQSQGYGTEAVRNLLASISPEDTHGVPVVVMVKRGNTAAIRALEKAGIQFGDEYMREGGDDGDVVYGSYEFMVPQ